MNLYYAMGGGLGHLTRARAFLETLGIEDDSVILTASPFASDRRVVGRIPVCRIDPGLSKRPAEYRSLLRRLLAEMEVRTLYLDSFPAGIAGEFSEFDFEPHVNVEYVARLLRWKNYAPFLQGSIPRFARTFVLEPLAAQHRQFIDRYSDEQIEMRLSYSAHRLSAGDERLFGLILKKTPFWLVVHAGSADETAELAALAAEMRRIEKQEASIVVISPAELHSQEENVTCFQFYPASALFPHAARIFTACGFNAMAQASQFRDRHHFLPFDRRFDDQYLRAARYRRLNYES